MIPTVYLKNIRFNPRQSNIDKLANEIFLFDNIFHDVIYSEGFFIQVIYLNVINKSSNNIKIKRTYYNYHRIVPTSPEITLSKITKLARQYGLRISKKGVITGFNKNKIKRNIHLLTANELGLI